MHRIPIFGLGLNIVNCARISIHGLLRPYEVERPGICDQNTLMKVTFIDVFPHLGLEFVPNCGRLDEHIIIHSRDLCDHHDHSASSKLYGSPWCSTEMPPSYLCTSSERCSDPLGEPGAAGARPTALRRRPRLDVGAAKPLNAVREGFSSVQGRRGGQIWLAPFATFQMIK